VFNIILIVLTGFGPFKNNIRNLSGEIARVFNSQVKDYQIIKKILPVSWKNSINSYKNILGKNKELPKLVLLLGIHQNKNLHLERYAWNFKYGQDNENSVKFGIIKYYYPLRLKSIIDIPKLYSSLKNVSNIFISEFSGLYLCNYVYYWALDLSKKEYPVMFIHIPAKGKLNECINKIRNILETTIKIHYDKRSNV